MHYTSLEKNRKISYYTLVLLCIFLLLFRTYKIWSIDIDSDIIGVRDLSYLKSFVSESTEYISWVNLDSKRIIYAYEDDYAWVLSQFMAVPVLLENNVLHKNMICICHNPYMMKAFIRKTGYEIVYLFENRYIALMRKSK